MCVCRCKQIYNNSGNYRLVNINIQNNNVTKSLCNSYSKLDYKSKKINKSIKHFKKNRLWNLDNVLYTNIHSVLNVLVLLQENLVLL